MSYDWCPSCGDVIACMHRPNETVIRVLSGLLPLPEKPLTTEERRA